MKIVTREWVDKAEADFATAQREFLVRPDPNFDVSVLIVNRVLRNY